MKRDRIAACEIVGSADCQVHMSDWVTAVGQDLRYTLHRFFL